MQNLLKIIMDTCIDEYYLEDVINILPELVSHFAMKRALSTCAPLFMSLFTHTLFVSKYRECIVEQDEDTARGIVNYINELGENYMLEMTVKGDTNDIMSYLKIMMDFTAFPGIPYLDQNITYGTHHHEYYSS